VQECLHGRVCLLLTPYLVLLLMTPRRLWLQPLSVRSGLVPPAAAAARQAGVSDSFKQLRRVVVQSGRVARPGARGQREEWAVKFEGINSREQVGHTRCAWLYSVA